MDINDVIKESKTGSGQHSTILAPTNHLVHQINGAMLKLEKGEERVYKSYDNTVDNSSTWPESFLNRIDPNGCLLHVLHLKIGSPIICLRNLNPSRGLLNGTRLIVKSLLQRTILATILTGPSKGEDVFIPRIWNTSDMSSDLPFTLLRLQFPVSLCYSMTINKSQGQTMSNIILYLPSSLFSHGQLYVALSRCNTTKGI